MSIVASLRRRSARDIGVLAEAVLMLTAASICVATIPFRRVIALAASQRPNLSPASPAVARRIADAISVCAKRAPWPSVCFQQGLAAHWMLRRRGCSSTLHYGARQPAYRRLEAHVWVRSGDQDVVGCERADEFGLLSTFDA